MTSLLVGLLVCVGVAVVVIVVVALPHLREGAPILAPEGERLADEARQRAARAAGAATAVATAAAGALKEKVTGRDGEAADERPAGVPPRQVASAAATPAPGTPVVVEPSTAERVERASDEVSADRPA